MCLLINKKHTLLQLTKMIQKAYSRVYGNLQNLKIVDIKFCFIN